MQNYLKFTVVTLVAFTLGVFVNSYAVSNTANNLNVAIVDIQQIIDSSQKAQAIKLDQKKKFEELVSFVGEARGAIESEQDPAKRKTIEEKYQSEFAAKKNAIDKDYEAKLASFNTEITREVDNITKEKKYDLVLLKSTVLSGGNDITQDVVKNIK